MEIGKEQPAIEVPLPVHPDDVPREQPAPAPVHEPATAPVPERVGRK